MLQSRTRNRLTVVTLAGALLSPALAASQTALVSAQSSVAPVASSAQTPLDEAKSAALIQMTRLRDSFVQGTRASGVPCSIQPPTLQITDVPSFGNYDEDHNFLETPIWELLTPAEVAIFTRVAGPNSTEAAARQEFETGARHWVFIHEMGHWWQACRNASAARKPWAIEYEADRIAAAWWRERDPHIVDHMARVFRGLVDHVPEPTPAGQDRISYFNDHYQQLGPTPAYIWYQSKMCVLVFDETPPPTFTQTLKDAGK